MIWITLLSRLNNRQFGMAVPFSSFAAIVNGSKNALIETVENIFLFIPLGFFLRRMFGIGRAWVVVSGLVCSLLIENFQWIFRLGTVEVDDLIMNTIGAAIGAIVPGSVVRKKWLLVNVVIVMIAVVVPVGKQVIVHNHMVQLASNLDYDGKKNLLVLNGDPGYTWSGDVYVSYNDDGSIRISGSSDVRSWKPIGYLILPAGEYSFSGLSGVPENTIAIELESYNEDIKKFIRLTPDVGPVDIVFFTLDKDTQIKAYVGVYPGAEGDYVARPVIYKED